MPKTQEALLQSIKLQQKESEGPEGIRTVLFPKTLLTRSPEFHYDARMSQSASTFIVISKWTRLLVEDLLLSSAIWHEQSL